MNKNNFSTKKILIILLFIIFLATILFFYLDFTKKQSTELDKNAVKDTGTEEVVMDTYTVQEGDTLEDIASQYGISVETVKWANNLTSDSVEIGTELIIPPMDGVFVTVKEGDTLDSIAEEYSVDEQVIADFNWLDYPYSLTVGEELFIPGGRN